jgi:DNA helicase-2/ATP-dependent DNA helicase PcrA
MSKESPLLTGLSSVQRAAVIHTGGPLLVLAGAGAGKTRVLATRAAWLVEQGRDPARIVVATFTNRATAEFKGRLAELMGDRSQELWMGTLHAVGSRLLRRHGHLGDLEKEFRIIGPAQVRDRLREIAAQHQLKQPRLRIAREAISRFKGMLVGPADVTAELLWNMEPIAEEVRFLYERYEQALRENSELDLDDLILRSAALLAQAPEVGEQLGIEAVLVDEAQDVDPAQLALIRLLLGSSRCLTLVADGDQTVYSWRGAKSEHVVRFEVEFPDGHVISLGQNWRCDQRIVRAADTLIRLNRERREHKLWSDRRDGQAPIVQPVVDDEQEAEWVVAEIQRLAKSRTLPWRAFAILYRANFLSQPFEDQLVARSIPYHVLGSRFWDRREIVEVLMYLRLVLDPEDIRSLRVLADPGRGKLAQAQWSALITAQLDGQSFRDRLLSGEELPMNPDLKVRLARIFAQVDDWRARAGQLGLAQLIMAILHESGRAAFWEKKDEEREVANRAVPNLNRLIVRTARFFAGTATIVLPAFLDYVKSMVEESGPGERDAVQLMTLHGAKGMEFPVVFVAGCEQGLLPHWQAGQAGEYGRQALEEERRLMYVGMTRAERWLYLTYAQVRRGASGLGRMAPRSQFLNEIPAELLQWRELPDREGQK